MIISGNTVGKVESFKYLGSYVQKNEGFNENIGLSAGGSS